MTEGILDQKGLSISSRKCSRQWWNGFLVGIIFCIICGTMKDVITNGGVPVQGKGGNNNNPSSLLFDTGNVIELLSTPMGKTQTELEASGASGARITGLRMKSETTQQLQQQQQQQKERYAIAVYVERYVHLYGLYGMIQQIHKLGMIAQGIDIVVIATNTWTTTTDTDTTTTTSTTTREQSLMEQGNVLKTWLQEGLIQNLIFQDHDHIIRKVKENGLWSGVFNKLVFFNLTEYDKVIGFDADILIRKNIYHWFTDFATPCAIQSKDLIEWNSGAMIIEPSSEVFDALVNKLSDVRRHIPSDASNMTKPDTWNTGFGHQGFLSSYFTVSDDPKHRMKTMGRENAILSSALTGGEKMDYFWYRRNHIFQTIHLTVTKPWLLPRIESKHKWRSPIICEILKEFHTSINGMEKYNLTIKNQYLIDCFNSTTTPIPTDIKNTNITTVTATTAAALNDTQGKKMRDRRK